MVAATKLTVLDRDPGCTGWLRPTPRLRVVKNADREVAETALNVFVFAVASELPAVADFVREANRRHQLRVLLVHADMDERWIAPMLARAELRTLRNLLVHRGPEVPRRVVEAWLLGAQDDLIADAVVFGETLLVLTCSLEPIEVRIDRVAPLRNLREDERSRFEIASDGSYLHWPSSDIHLDL
ncbi:MAG: hypothetical protein FJ125_00980, partial [Deltaproteobacteria bacterium]|nr:hypothetical protein [Deltaproteobacteria bacterium]